MRRFWIDEFVGEEQQDIILEGEILHHVKDVCRMSYGSRFEILTPEKKAYFVELLEVNKKSAVARILEERSLPEIPGPQIHLCLSIPKFSTLENIIEKSVELGVHSIQPFFSEFSFVRKSSKISASRQERWRKIVKSATQQSGRGDLMTVESPVKLPEFLKKINQNSGLRGLFAYEGSSRHMLGEAISGWEDSPLSSNIFLFVGSEGGFSNKEVELFQQYNLEPVTLGEQILRVETACVALISIIKYQVRALG